MQVRYDAVILAGGAGSRLGGIDKAAVALQGAPLIQRALDATSDASARVVVGHTDAQLPADVTTTVEDPAGGGPAAAFLAGLHALAPTASEWTVLLACDLPGAQEGMRRLDRTFGQQERARSAASGDAAEPFDGVVLTDPDGRFSWVCGLYRTSAVRAAAADLGEAINRGLKALLSPLRLIPAAPRANEWRDVDTWDDHAAWVALLNKPSGGVMPENTIERAQWEAWVTKASAALEIDPALVDITLVHELSRNVAHNVIRPLAPVSTYMLGIAVGRRLAAGEAVDEDVRRELAALIPQSPQDAPSADAVRPDPDTSAT